MSDPTLSDIYFKNGLGLNYPYIFVFRNNEMIMLFNIENSTYTKILSRLHIVWAEILVKFSGKIQSEKYLSKYSGHFHDFLRPRNM